MSNKLRIGIVTEWFDRGSANVSLNYVKFLRKNNFEVYIYTRQEHEMRQVDAWRDNNLHFGKKTWNSFGKSINKRDFEKWITDNKLRSIIFNEQQWCVPVIWAKKLGVHTVGYLDYYTRTSIQDFHVYDLLIAHTKRHQSAFNWHGNCLYIPWGTDISIDWFSPEKLRKLDCKTFFHSCGWSPDRKGTEILLKAFSSLKEYDFKLIIHSQIDLFEFFKGSELINILNDNSLNIQVIHETVAPPGLYHLGNIYVYPTKLEGVGLTIAEALLSGTPVIVPDCPPMNEFVHEEYSKKLPIREVYFREDNYFWPMIEVNAAELAKAMLDISTLDQSETQQLVSISRNNFDFNKNAMPLIPILNSAVPKKSNYGKLFITQFRSSGFRIQILTNGLRNIIVIFFRSLFQNMNKVT
jgi:1,2-diacylglycerol 3-alpha-glucosyltransferase